MALPPPDETLKTGYAVLVMGEVQPLMGIRDTFTEALEVARNLAEYDSNDPTRIVSIAEVRIIPTIT